MGLKADLEASFRAGAELADSSLAIGGNPPVACLISSMNAGADELGGRHKAQTLAEVIIQASDYGDPPRAGESATLVDMAGKSHELIVGEEVEILAGVLYSFTLVSG